MRSIIATVINSRVQMHAFFIFVTSKTILCFFYCKERYCDCISSGIFPSSIQEMSSVVFFNFGVFARAQIKNETYNCFSLAACLFPLL